MATFVLVHGGFHGGWCWKRVRERLQKAGHDVFTPTLTGLGERSHLASKDIDLDTHVTDVMNVFLYEDLNDVILVGHSAGMSVITNVADRIPERLRHLAYFDGWVPEHGKCHLDYAPGWSEFASQPDGMIPVPSDFAGGLCGITDPQDQQWVQSRLTPHPYKVLEGKLSFQNPATLKVPRTYIDCTYGSVWGKQKLIDAGWNYVELPTGHDAMITEPEKLTALLIQIAESQVGDV